MAGDGLQGNSPPEESVLADLCLNNGPAGPGGRAASDEEADRRIAKALQDQERAFMLLDDLAGEIGWQRDAERADGGSSSGWEEADEEDEEEKEEGGVDAAAAREAGEGGSEAGEEGGGSEGEGELEQDDAELARRLQEEEDREHYRRLIELTGGGGIAEEYDEDEDEEGYVTEDSVDPDNMTYEELQALGEAVGTVSRGVPQDVIDALPNARYASRFADAAAAKGSGEEEEQCAVCRMEFEPGEDLRRLPCSHMYHPACIGQWLHINKACPICGKEVTQAQGSAAAQERSSHVLEPRNK